MMIIKIVYKGLGKQHDTYLDEYCKERIITNVSEITASESDNEVVIRLTCKDEYREDSKEIETIKIIEM